MKAEFLLAELLSTVTSEPKQPREARTLDIDGAVTGGYIHPEICRTILETPSSDVANPTTPTRTSTQTFDITEDWNGQSHRLESPTQLVVLTFSVGFGGGLAWSSLGASTRRSLEHLSEVLEVSVFATYFSFVSG